MKRLGRTPPFRGPHGEPVRDSIAEINYLPLGGFEQWVMIRGERLANPALILLHGGPGFGETHFFRRYNAPLESHFTVVYWDQRGTGKSFRGDIDRSSMTVEQFIADLDDLVEVVRTRLGQDRVTIFGHSWGSALGALYAARFPEKVALYIGCEQVGDWIAAEQASYAFALAEAERRHHAKAVAQLRAIGRPPYDNARSVFVERIWIQRFEGQLSPRAWWIMARDLFGCSEMSVVDLPDIVRGFRFTLDAMWPDIRTLNLFTRVPALQMPVFFFAGRRDRWIPPDTSVAYFNALNAPSKELVWFEQSAHEPFVDEPAKFNRTMIELVRPSVDAAIIGRLRRAG
jgi:pimeloyl-ACP methyl ester carboxylesterase